MVIRMLMMANNVFLDTNGWLALLNASDKLHLEANRIWHDLGTRQFYTPLPVTNILSKLVFTAYFALATSSSYPYRSKYPPQR